MSNLRITQLIHPGIEQNRFDHVGGAATTAWNEAARAHRRKFLLQSGTAVKRTPQGQWRRTPEHPLTFWAEWEAESRLVKELDQPGENGRPQFLVGPFWRKKRSYAGLHNTDPNVFDGPFKYITCLQNGALTRLERGSIILFGSENRREGEFILDTVFVVDCWKDYFAESVTKELRGVVSETYFNVSVAPLGSSDGCGVPVTKRTNRRLYFGATFDSPVDGMFSFFPCKPYKGENEGFPRPAISFEEYGVAPNGKSAPIVNGEFFNGKRYTLWNRPEDVAKIWDKLVDQVIGEGLMLGIEAQTPERERH